MSLWYTIQTWLVFISVAMLPLAFAARLRGVPRMLLASGAALVALHMLLTEGLYRLDIWLPPALEAAASAIVVGGWCLLVAGALKLGSGVEGASGRAGSSSAMSIPVAGADEVICVDAYRSRSERLATGVLSFFSVLVIVVFAGILLAAPEVFAMLAVYTLFLVAGVYVAARVARGVVLGGAVKVGPEQFPEIHRIKLELMARFDYDEELEVFVAEQGSLNAILSKFIATRYVVLTSGLVETMNTGTRQEITFVIARAVAHLKAKHFRFWLVRFLIALERINPLAYFWYERMCHYSSDRMALVACGSPMAARSALVKLAVGGTLEQYVRFGSIEAQRLEVAGSFGALLAEVFSQHPHLIKRIEALRGFAEAEATAPAEEASAADAKTVIWAT